MIIGQDPYHEPGQAHGLSFSVKPGVTIPPSLVNIYQELHDDLGCKIPNNGYLEKWADQGVLMLNAVLTVQAHRAGSSGKGLGTFYRCSDQDPERAGQTYRVHPVGCIRPEEGRIPEQPTPPDPEVRTPKSTVCIQGLLGKQAVQQDQRFPGCKRSRAYRLADRGHLILEDCTHGDLYCKTR